MARSDTWILPLSSSSWDFLLACFLLLTWSPFFESSHRFLAFLCFSSCFPKLFLVLIVLAWTCLDMLGHAWTLSRPHAFNRCAEISFTIVRNGKGEPQVWCLSLPQPAVWDIQALKRLCRTSAHLHEVKLLGKITINCLIFIMPVPTKDPSARGHHRSYAAPGSHWLWLLAGWCDRDDVRGEARAPSRENQRSRARLSRWKRCEKVSKL